MEDIKNKIPQNNEWADFQTSKAISNYPKWPCEVMVKIIFGGYLSQKLSPDPSWKVLDVGCGFGNNLVPFLDMNCECHGIEIHPDMAEVTENVLKKRGYQAEVKTGSNQDLPYKDNTFDLLLSLNTLHYEGNKNNVMNALKEFDRVLKPGGSLFLYTVSPEHEIFQRSKPLGENQHLIQGWDFRDGQIFYFFEDSQHLKKTCEEVFKNIETGAITENLVSLQIGFFIAVCRK